ncbi:hypothetical protein BV20DRAFT_934875 [Pilatotrama ljubarskyi]|nr:hypothetical protein BV20DRAFT_934875 [Pilatotrama ljubarskyi]
MSSRQRSATTSRKDAYGLWRPSDSDSDRPRQTMATSQRHNVDQPTTTEGSRKHRSSRRADPQDPSTAYSHHHKSSSKDRTSTAIPPSYYAVPQSPHPSVQSRTYDAYSDAYGLRAYLKRKTDKRSPRSSNEKVPAPDDPQATRSVYPSRHHNATTAAHAQPPASTSFYTVPPDQTTRDPTSSSRHHREREKDREKTSRREVEQLSMRDYAAERSEGREKRRREEKETAKEKERSSKDRDRQKEKERSKHRDLQPRADRKPPDTASIHQAYAQGSASYAQRSADRLPSAYPDQGRIYPQAGAHVAASSAVPNAPWTGLTTGGRAASVKAPAPAVEGGYPSASDREDPPLPIPPPGHKRERSSSKAGRSQRHQVLAQQAAQDSGISSSEQEHSGMERVRVTDRRHISREQASTLGRGQSSGPSGSENEKAPTIQKERRKHRTHGEPSRHKSKTTAVDGQPSSGPTTSQEIAQAWYSQHQRERSGTKQSAPSGNSPQRISTAVPHDSLSTHAGAPYAGKPTAHVGLTTSQRPTPQLVSIRAAQGPSDAHAAALLPKLQSTTSVNRQGDPQPADRAYETVSRAQGGSLGAQQYLQSAVRQQDTVLQTAPSQAYASAPGDNHRVHTSITPGATGKHQQPVQGYPVAASHHRHADANGVVSGAVHGGHQAVLPDVVVRPPSAAPMQHDPSPSRTAADVPPHQLGVVSGPSAGRLQVPSHDPRSRGSPAHPQSTSHSHSANTAAQQASHSHPQSSAQHLDLDPYRSASAGAGAAQQYGVSDLHRITNPAPHESVHTRGASYDLPSRFPLHEDPAGAPALAAYGSQHTAVAYNQQGSSRATASASQGQASASPKRNMTYPGASAPASTAAVHVNPPNYNGDTAHDLRSPKPPSVTTITPDTPLGRSQAFATHGKEASGQRAHHQPSPRHDQSGAQLAGDPGYAHALGTSAGHSPSRQHLADPGRFPAVGHAVSVGSAGTPKHSPSGRLHSHRNGSNDTITHAAPTKPSPSSTLQQQLPHRTSATNLHAHAHSRPDNASVSRQPYASSGYPEPARYRSPAPPGYPTAQPAANGATTGHSQSYSTQTPLGAYDYQHGRTPAPPAQTAQYPQTTSPSHTRNPQAADYGHRTFEPPHSAPPTSSVMPVPGQRVPPRSAASPAPAVRPPRLHAVSSPPGKAPVALQSTPPQPTRNQTYPAPAPIHPLTPFPPAHSRTASDPQYAGRSGNSAYPSANSSSRAQGSTKTAQSAAPQPDVLLTPSSLAPSMLPQIAPPAPLGRTTSKTSTKEKDKDPRKKGFFGLSLFRSRSSPPRQREMEPLPSAAPVREKRPRNVSQPTQPLARMQAPYFAIKQPATTPTPQVAVAAVSIPAPPRPHRGNSADQARIAAPTPVSASGNRSPNGKMFTPFRLLSRRHRTVSAASVEAVDGTVINAMLTGGDSTRSSTAGRPSPPLRDPMTAAQEWRNREEHEQQVRGTLRRRRPGVTFDVSDEVPDDGRVPVQKSLRANMASLQATAAPVPNREATA